jgi:hypothetical protein
MKTKLPRLTVANEIASPIIKGKIKIHVSHEEAVFREKQYLERSSTLREAVPRKKQYLERSST